FYVNDEGEEITTRLVNTGGFVTYYSAFLAQKSSDYYFQCLEDSTILCFTYEYVQAGYQQYPELERFGRLVAESIIHILESRMRSFHFQSAQERYLDFVRQYPDLTNRISLNHLSSYLGVKRPSLSRIRKKLMNNT
ncbi:MAG: Crp/Fnr family transcriptional regulator, partial [Bacteroidota bacterium]